MRQEHQRPAGIDGVAERLELAGQDAEPGRDHQPAGRRVVVEVGVGGEPGLPQHRPGLLQIDPLVGDVEGVAEEMVAVGEGAREQRRRRAIELVRHRRCVGGIAIEQNARVGPRCRR